MPNVNYIKHSFFSPKTQHIAKKNHEIARLWCRERNRRFNRFHKELVDEKLKSTLKNIYNADFTIQEHP